MDIDQEKANAEKRANTEKEFNTEKRDAAVKTMFNSIEDKAMPEVFKLISSLAAELSTEHPDAELDTTVIETMLAAQTMNGFVRAYGMHREDLKYPLLASLVANVLTINKGVIVTAKEVDVTMLAEAAIGQAPEMTRH